MLRAPGLRLLFLAGLALGGPLRAETWILRDARTGEFSGPFTPSNGAVVALGGRDFSLQISQTARDRAEARLRSIIIPAVEFRGAAVADVVNFLIEAGIAADPDREGINMVLKTRRLEGWNPPAPEADDRLAPRAGAGVDEWNFGGGDAPPEPEMTAGTVTLNLRRISLYDAIATIAEVAGLAWNISPAGVVVFREKERPAPAAP